MPKNSYKRAIKRAGSPLPIHNPEIPCKTFIVPYITTPPEQCAACLQILDLYYTTCSLCQFRICEDCYDKGYWIEVFFSDCYPMKIPEGHTDMYEGQVYHFLDEVYFVCSNICKETFMTNYQNKVNQSKVF